MSAKTIDSIAVIIAMIIGIIFFGSSIVVFKNLDGTCPNSTIRISWAIIQALGCCMIAAGIAYFTCILRNDCYSDIDSSRTVLVYYIIFGVLSLFVLSLCIAILVEYNKLSKEQRDNCDNKEGSTKTATITLITFSSIGIIASSLLSISHFKNLA